MSQYRRGHHNGSTLSRDLRVALDRHELHPVYQPQFDTRTNRLVAVESLCRWRHPEFGYVDPEFFIGVADREGILDEIGHFMLDDACRRAAVWAESGADVEIAFNVAPSQLEPRFIGAVVDAHDAYGLKPGMLTIEITESRPLMDRASVVRGILRSLLDAGIGVSLDDYGSGGASLSELGELDVTELKLDRALVQEETPAALLLIRESVVLAHARGCRVVAEGIETQAEFDRAVDAGCDRAQGYMLGRPMSGEHIERQIREQRDRD